MLIKISMTLRKECPTHLPLPKFLELIKNDSVLSPVTKTMLEGLKKKHLNYVPIPLGHDVILDSERAITLHKDTKPENKVWTREDWTDNDKADFLKDSQVFVHKILHTYELMGYECVVNLAEEKEVEDILFSLEKLLAKAKKRLQRLMK